MKNLLLVILMSCAVGAAHAQKKNSLYADVGTSNGSLVAGGSITYSRALTKLLNVGIGTNYYDYGIVYHNRRFAQYIDLRPTIFIGKSMLFTYLDAGVATIGGNTNPTATVRKVNFYSSFALGYCYRINKRGMGPYVTAGIYGYGITEHLNNPALPVAARDYSVFDATSILSIGFRF